MSKVKTKNANENALANYSNPENRIKLISKIILYGFLVASFYHFVYQSILLNKPYPFNTFLFLQSDRFNDFLSMRDWCKDLNPYFSPNYLGNSNYLPIANLFFFLFLIYSSKSIFIPFCSFIFWIDLFVYLFKFGIYSGEK
ncbi:MAG: hypothetical protein HY062_08480 [Bacteroidetes bacterium]|nr:hypothetical protein [Bacteroidota bacterium]